MTTVNILQIQTYLEWCKDVIFVLQQLNLLVCKIEYNCDTVGSIIRSLFIKDENKCFHSLSNENYQSRAS